MSPQCAIYTRQSRTRLGVASSCEMQREICADYARERGWIIADQLFDDLSESSETLERPGLQRLWQEIEQGSIQRVVVYAVDRLTRRLYDLHRLLDLFERHEVEFNVVNDPDFGESAANRLTSNIVAAASEFQQELTRERMADARTALKRQGRRVAGRVPFGYQVDPATKQLILCPSPAEIVRQLFHLAAAGNGPQEIAETAQQQQWQPAGKSEFWTARQVLKVLSNPTYAGLIHIGDETLPGRHEAIVSLEQFEQVRNAIQARRTRRPGRKLPSIAWPLRGILKCGQCGRVMSPTVSGYKNFRYRYYRCRSRAGGRPPCKEVGISAYQIEEFVRATLSCEDGRLADPTSVDPMQEFTTAWRGLDQREQFAALAKVLQEVHFDPSQGTLAMTLVDRPTERICRS